MRARYQQAVPGEHGAVIEEGQRVGVLEDDLSGGGVNGDAAEDTHGRQRKPRIRDQYSGAPARETYMLSSPGVGYGGRATGAGPGAETGGRLRRKPQRFA